MVGKLRILDVFIQLIYRTVRSMNWPGSLGGSGIAMSSFTGLFLIIVERYKWAIMIPEVRVHPASPATPKCWSFGLVRMGLLMPGWNPETTSTCRLDGVSITTSVFFLLQEPSCKCNSIVLEALPTKALSLCELEKVINSYWQKASCVTCALLVVFLLCLLSSVNPA